MNTSSAICSAIRKEFEKPRFIAADSHVFFYVLEKLAKTLESDKEKHRKYFDCFAYVWHLLPCWSSSWLLFLVYREHKTLFGGITPHTPLEEFTPQQRKLLESRCEEVLTTLVTLFSSHKLTQDYYKGWREAQEKRLAEQA
ncbi:MAG: hypothetical protein KTR20_14190 [Cellvibrionaceae bacterium]|nr:hypothetical protein [Cellvibrionaceae bacterium]